VRGICAAAGAASVAAMCFASPMSYTLTANVLTVTGYTAWGAIDGDMDDLFQGEYCNDASGNTCSPVRYLSALPAAIAEPDGYRALRSAIKSISEPTTVVAYSQGATISTYWLRDNAGRPGAPAPENLSFVFAGNPMRKYGGIRPASGLVAPTPDTEYAVTDIALEYDGAADFPDNPFNLLAVANAIAGFQYVHIFGYDEVDLDTADKLVWKDGNTTYVLIRSENLPLLQPLRLLGLDELADRLTAPLKAIIDSAYNRDYPGMIEGGSVQDTATRQVSASFSDEDADKTADDSPAQIASSVAQDGVDARPAKHAGGAADQQEESETTSLTTTLDTDDESAAEPGSDVDADAETEADADADIDAGASAGAGAGAEADTDSADLGVDSDEDTSEDTASDDTASEDTASEDAPSQDNDASEDATQSTSEASDADSDAGSGNSAE